MKKIILLILILTASLSGHKIATKLINYYTVNNYYTETQSLYTSNISNNNNDPYIIAPHITSTQPPIEIDFESLEKINSDIIGWIYSEDTSIHYPILHTDNNVYYLKHLLNHEYSVNGSIFLDAINKEDFSDDNSILYGHHMRDGSMFASIEKYKEQEYYNQHPYLWLFTEEKQYMLSPFAGLVVPSTHNYFISTFENSKIRNEYLTYAINNSSFIGLLLPNEADKIVTLTTCDYTFENARFILLCVLIQVI